VEAEKLTLFSEHVLEGYQDPVDEGGDLGTELANSVSRDKQGRAVWLNRKAKVDGCDAWTTYWLSQGMPRVWVDFWRLHNWSWDTAEVTTELREYINKEGFLTAPAPDSLWVRHA